MREHSLWECCWKTAQMGEKWNGWILNMFWERPQQLNSVNELKTTMQDLKELLCTGQTILDTPQLRSAEGQWYISQGHPLHSLYVTAQIFPDICWQPKPCLGLWLRDSRTDREDLYLWLAEARKHDLAHLIILQNVVVSCYYGINMMRNCVSSI